MTTAAERKPLHIISTGDIHGALFPFDYLRGKPSTASMAHVAGYVAQARLRYGSDQVLLLDCGDLLQGGPTAFYINYLYESSLPHPVAQMMHFVGYDAMTVGNHDIETGHAVYDRFASDLSPIPLLAANITRTSGEPYFSPFTIIERGGWRVGVIGLTTETVVEWVPREVRSGLRVGDMLGAARRWVEYVKTHHHPDIIVGLFHSGYETKTTPTSTLPENISARIAAEVPGFDLIIMGHDHCPTLHSSPSGALLVNAGAHASRVVDVTVASDGQLSAKVVRLNNVIPDADFVARFSSLGEAVRSYVSQPVGYASCRYRSDEALGTLSPFMRVLHEAQLQATGAQVSVAAPVIAGALVGPGPLTVADLYRFYRFDNGLCVMRLTVGELRCYLDYSRRLLALHQSGESVPIYDLDTAMGEMPGDDVADSEWIEVALNTYRACGGGGHLTLGAAIPSSQLESRIVRTLPGTVRDALAAYF